LPIDKTGAHNTILKDELHVSVPSVISISNEAICWSSIISSTVIANAPNSNDVLPPGISGQFLVPLSIVMYSSVVEIVATRLVPL